MALAAGAPPTGPLNASDFQIIHRDIGDDPAADLNLMLSQSAAANLAAPSLEWDVPRTIEAIAAALAGLP